MTDPMPAAPADHSRGEERANWISHGLGLLLAAAGAPVLMVSAAQTGSAFTIVGAAVFAAAVLLVYAASTMHHALPDGRSKRVFLVMDYLAIYVLIAGTYTPFMLGAMRGPWGWSLFGIIWALASVGVVKTLLGMRADPAGEPKPTLPLYVAMGWVAMVAVPPMLARIDGWGLFWIAAGGLAYTLGVAFFAARRMPYNHCVWHLLVLAGTVCHFMAVIGYAG